MFELSIKTSFTHLHPQPLPIGDKFYGALLIGEVYIPLLYFPLKSAHHPISGVTKGIILTHGDNGYLRIDHRQELRSGGGV